MVSNDYQINNIFLFPYQFALKHFQAISQEAEWNGRVVVHLVLGIFEILPTGINYIIAIFDAVFHRNPAQAPIPAAPSWPSLPEDLFGELSTFLTPEELGRCMSVCKSWGKCISQNKVWSRKAQQIGIINSTTQIENVRGQLFAKPAIAFGRGEWIRHIGDSGEIPPLPLNIYEILQSPCPFWPTKSVKDTHILVFIPRTVTRIINSTSVTIPLTLRTLDELLKSSNNGKGVGYRYIWDQILQEHGDTPIEESHWVLMTNDVIPGSRNQPYAHQKSLVKNAGYEVPSILDAAAPILLEYIRSGQSLFSDKPWTYARCQQAVNGYQLVVGGFAPAGLFVGSERYYDSEFLGVAGMRKFSGH